jgi:hypothetical protein
MDTETIFFELSSFCHRVFDGCQVFAETLPEPDAYRVLVQINNAGTWEFKPPKGFCVMGVRHKNGKTTFAMIVFKVDFINYHLSQVFN